MRRFSLDKPRRCRCYNTPDAGLPSSARSRARRLASPPESFRPVAGRCKPPALALVAVLLLGGAVSQAAAQVTSFVGEPPEATTTASAATGRMCINIPSPPAGIHSAVRSGLRVTFANGGTASLGRGSCSGDADLVVAGDYGGFYNLGNASLGQNNCFQVQICGAHAVGTTFVVDIHGKVHPKKPGHAEGAQLSTAFKNWSNAVTGSGYSASFKATGHCRVTASHYGGPLFAQICRTRVTIVD